MRTSLIASLFALAVTVVSAQNPYWNITSAPFKLLLLSKNETINGTSLSACHEGAAIEGLCVGGKKAQPTNSNTFRFNTTLNDDGKAGLLVWKLVGGNFVVSSPMELSYNPISNVAIPLFMPSDSGTIVRFDKDNKLTIQAYTDDTVVPENRNKIKNYYRWYACQTYYGYSYHTLAWAVGKAKPQNPTCTKVDVLRVFTE